tara:strand:+ start:267 stop:584 length:318 start_codon:yes stop_codon:yes gene_type:complete
MSAFSEAWSLLKARLALNPPDIEYPSAPQICGKEGRIFMEGGSGIGRCIREKGHPPTGPNVGNRMQVALGGHDYVLAPGLRMDDRDLFPPRDVNDKLEGGLNDGV